MRYKAWAFVLGFSLLDTMGPAPWSFTLLITPKIILVLMSFMCDNALCNIKLKQMQKIKKV